MSFSNHGVVEGASCTYSRSSWDSDCWRSSTEAAWAGAAAWVRQTWSWAINRSASKQRYGLAALNAGVMLASRPLKGEEDLVGTLPTSGSGGPVNHAWPPGVGKSNSSKVCRTKGGGDAGGR